MITAQLTLSGTPEELQDVLSKLNGYIPKVMESSELMSATVEELEKAAAKSSKKTTKQAKLDLPKEEPEVEETTVSVVDLRSEIQAKAKAGKRDEIKKLLKEFGAASVTELDEDHYGEFKLKLDKI